MDKNYSLENFPWLMDHFICAFFILHKFKHSKYLKKNWNMYLINRVKDELKTDYYKYIYWIINMKQNIK